MTEFEKAFPRWYYTLDEAAKELKCTDSFLVHLAETDRLEILWKVTDRGFYARIDEINDGENIVYDHCIRVDFLSLKSYEVPSPSFSRAQWNNLYLILKDELHSPFTTEPLEGNNSNEAFEIYTLGQWEKFQYAYDLVRFTHQMIKVEPTFEQIPRAQLYISAGEFLRLLHREPNSNQASKSIMSRPKDETPQHKNAELNAQSREKVFKAALVIKDAYPTKAAESGSAWAGEILDKWHKIFPDDAPDVKLPAQATIAGYLNKLPKLQK